jgi:hypothetical protein
MRTALLLFLLSACECSVASSPTSRAPWRDLPGTPVSMVDDEDAGVRCYLSDWSSHGSRGISCLKVRP